MNSVQSPQALTFFHILLVIPVITSAWLIPTNTPLGSTTPTHPYITLRATSTSDTKKSAATTDLIELTDANYASLLRAETPILIDCSAKWCGPCKLLEPLVVSLAQKYVGSSTPLLSAVAKYDVESQNPNIKMEFALQGVHPTTLPSLILFCKGKAIGNRVGLISEEELEEFIVNECRAFVPEVGKDSGSGKKGFVSLASLSEPDDYMLASE